MDSARKNQKVNLLITDTASYLGSQLAKVALGTNCIVFGIGSSHLAHNILSNHDFTLLEIDLSQPLPTYLPQFDVIFDLSLIKDNRKNISQMPNISPQIQNIITLAKTTDTKVFIFAPITTSHEFYDYLTQSAPTLKENISLLLVGDLYGPNMGTHEQNNLMNLIGQAQKTDKIILQNEGLDQMYPAYITDVVAAANKHSFSTNKLAFSAPEKKIHYLVSQGAITTLSASYEIQNILRIVANKEIGLFFSGPQTQIYPEPEINIKIHDLGFSPKVDLKEGLKKTFEYLKSMGQIEEEYKTEGQKLQPAPQVPTLPLFENQKPKRTAHLPKIPAFSFNFKYKKLVLILALAFILTIAKTTFDIVWGAKNLHQAQTSLALGEFEKAKESSHSSQKSFHAASNKIKILFFPATFVLGEKVQSLNHAMEAAETSAKAAGYFIEGSQTLAHDFSQIATPDAKNDGFDLELPSANFKKAYVESSQAMYLLKEAKNLPFQKELEKAQKDLSTLHSLSQKAYELTNLTGDFVGIGGKKTYLVLLQNNTELRPGGGFIGNFATLEFDQGKLKDVSVEDIYTIDGQLKEKIEPPRPLADKLGIDNLYLRDSNWSGDFEQNSKTARDFFKKETGKDVDGVIAIDLTLLQDILKKIGPINLSDYKEQITADNLFERGEYYSEVGFFPGSTQKRDFFGALSRALIAKIMSDLKQPSNSLLALVETSAQSLPQKHLMLTFDDPILASFIKTKGYNQPMPPLYFDPADDSKATRDFLALVEANLGANKVNRALDRKISYEMTVGKDADLLAKLTITYTNNSQAETWPGGKYVNYLRVYVPFAAGLEDFQMSIPPPPKEIDPKRRTPLSAQEDNIVDKADVDTNFLAHMTVFSTYVEVPIKSTQVVTLVYRIPKNIKLETNPTYSIYFQKQAGTQKDPLEFKFNLPAYLSVSKINGDDKYKGSQNVTLNTDLATDRELTIDLKKN